MKGQPEATEIMGPERRKSPLYRADLDRCLPASALSREGRLFGWRMIDYETAHFKGVMLRAGPETAAAAVEYPLELEGWHDVYLGLFNTAWRPYLDQRLWVKLTEDPAFSCLFLQAPDVEKGQVIQDLFWRTADLTGQRLSFRQVATELIPEGHPCRSTCDTVWVAYIKLVPLDPDEVEALRSDRKQTSTRRLFATQDWGSGFAWDASEGAIRDQLEAYRHTDFNGFYAMDVPGWIREGLIDGIIPYTSAEGLFSWDLAWERAEDIEYWLSLTRGTECELALNVMPRVLTPEQYRRKAHQLLKAGVPYLAFWDSSKTWAVDKIDAGSYQHLRRLGHSQELDDWIQAGEPNLVHGSTPLDQGGGVGDDVYRRVGAPLVGALFGPFRERRFPTAELPIGKGGQESPLLCPNELRDRSSFLDPGSSPWGESHHGFRENRRISLPSGRKSVHFSLRKNRV